MSKIILIFVVDRQMILSENVLKALYIGTLLIEDF